MPQVIHIDPIDNTPVGTGGGSSGGTGETGGGSGGSGGTGGGGTTGGSGGGTGTTTGVFLSPAVAGGDEYEVRLFDSAGLRKDLPQTQRGAASWVIKRKGGYDSFSLPVSGPGLDLQQDDRIDVYAKGNFQYRGYVSQIDLVQNEMITANLTGYGRSFSVGKIPITQKRLVYTAYVDVSLVVIDVINGWVLPQNTDISAEIESAGFRTLGVETGGKTVAQVMDALVDLCGGRASWGCDVDTETGRDRFYFRREGDRNAADYDLPVPAQYVSAAQTSLNSADIVNAGTFVGGTAQYPNLIPNASFESPQSPWDDPNQANLLPEPSFEHDPAYPDSAEMFDGGNRVENSAGGISPYEGSWMVHTENADEGARWEVTQSFAAGEPLGLSFYARPQSGVDVHHVPVAKVNLFWKKPDGSFVVDSIQIDLAPLAQSWDNYTNVDNLFAAPAGGAIGLILELKQIAGWGPNKGILWDSFALFRAAQLRQEGWFTYAHGSSQILSVDYVNKEAVFHGDLAVKMDVQAATATLGDESQTVSLRPEKAIPVSPGQRFRISARVKNVPSATLAVGGTIALVWQWFRPGAEDSWEGITYTATGFDGDFVTLASVTTVPLNVGSIAPSVHFLTNGAWIVDAFCLRDARAPSGADIPYLPDGNLSAFYRAADLVTEAEDADVHNSEAIYGKRLPSGGTVSADGVTTDAQLQAFAKGFLMSRAVLEKRPPVTVQDDDRQFFPGETVRLVGKNGVYLMGGQNPLAILPALPIATVRGSIGNGDVLTHTLELGVEQPSIASMIRDAVKGRR